MSKLRAVFCLLLLTLPALAQTPPPPAPRPRLPADVTTHHSLDLPGRTLAFAATAGSMTLNDAAGAPQAAIAFVAYTRDDPAPAARPVTFVLNGGPGASSAWLQLGLAGPWRLPMTPDAARPSASATPLSNADTWLDHTDLVFLDPIGTGFSRLLTDKEDARKKYWSVNGDIDSLAEVIRRWLQANHRMTSPKFLLGESYGGFRSPRLARALASEQGVGLNGLILVSPVLDFGGNSNAYNPLSWVYALPSAVATIRDRSAPVSRAGMADVEAYAAGDYLVDLLRGDRDEAAVARRIARISVLTGLDPVLLTRRRGMPNNAEFLRESNHVAIGSFYDATVTAADPYPHGANSYPPDAMTEALYAPVTSAMLELYTNRLNWVPDGTYTLNNPAVNRAWDWGAGNNRPESLGALRTAVALDPQLHVLIAHGFFDFVTPYFRTKLMLDPIPASAGADRIALEVYPGGHMFYSRDASRAAFRARALDIYQGK